MMMSGRAKLHRPKVSSEPKRKGEFWAESLRRGGDFCKISGSRGPGEGALLDGGWTFLFAISTIATSSLSVRRSRSHDRVSTAQCCPAERSHGRVASDPPHSRPLRLFSPTPSSSKLSSLPTPPPPTQIQGKVKKTSWDRRTAERERHAAMKEKEREIKGAKEQEETRKREERTERRRKVEERERIERMAEKVST